MNQKMIIFSAFRNKKYIVYTILITLLFILSCIFCINYNYFDYQINEILGKKELNRGLVLYYDQEDAEDFISALDHIDNFFPLYNDINLKIDKNTYKINSDFKKDIIYGKGIEKDDELIVSILYCRSIELEKAEIGHKTINLKDNPQKTFTIVGVTDDNHSHFYINNNAMHNVLAAHPDSYYLLIDSFPNVKKVIQYLENRNYSVEYFDSRGLYEIEEVQMTKKKYIYLILLIIIFFILFFTSIIRSIFTSELKNLSLYKAIGYKNKNIKKIIINRTTVILSISFTITIILNFLLSIIINKAYVSPTLLLKETTIIYFFGLLITYLSSIRITKKIKKINIIENLKSE